MRHNRRTYLALALVSLLYLVVPRGDSQRMSASEIASADAEKSATPASAEQAPTEDAPTEQGSTEEAIVQAAKHLLARAFPADARRLKVSVRQTSRIDPDARSLRAEFAVTPRQTPRGFVRLELYSMYQSREVGWAIVHLSRIDTVAAVRRDVAAGEPLTEDDITRAVIESSDAPQHVILYSELKQRLAGGNLAARRNLSSGSMIRPTDVVVAPDVEIGHDMAMELTAGGITIEVDVTSRERARIGDAIRVYSYELKQMYRARVVSTGRAEWLATL